MSNEAGSRGGRRSSGGRRYYSRPRSCQFCSDPELKIYYRNTQLLSNFVNREGKIRPRRQTGACAKHQRQVAVAVKRARHMALLQFAGESLN
ncbi:MAG: 30S ribosomal protein S18 [Anaerolineales bacterium]|jgi:small subunit ribosomal protein S18